MARQASRGLAALAAVLFLSAAPAVATQADQPLSVGQICDLISTSAEKHGLPKDFFARLIYKESRFDAKAISPVGAQGIAQFMPATAKARGLADPWDPRQAIPASAHFLADLRRAFGNFGLAAAAYNGGPDRVERFQRRGGGWLPAETVDYVRSITFRPVEWFLARGREVEARPLVQGRDFASSCRDLPIIATRALAPSLRWGVQIAGGRSHGAALRSAKRLRSRYASVLGGKPIRVVRNRRGIRGVPYQARIAVSTRKEAGQICARLKARGGACVVLRN